MYPTLFDLVQDLFGISIPVLHHVQSYGMMVGLGFIVGSVLFSVELKRKEALGQLRPTVRTDAKGRRTVIHAHEHVGNLAMLIGLGGIVGAKLFHLLENWNAFMNDPVGMATSAGGYSFYGGFVGGMGLSYLYAKKNGLSILPLIDSGIPAVAIGYGFGRLGCHISGDGDWGIPNDTPKPDWLGFLPDWMWAYDYPNNVLGVDLVNYYAQKGYTSLTGSAYPTPIYEMILSAFIFAFLWSMRKRWNTPGIMLSAYLILAGTERFFIEKIRINNEYDILGGITQAEIISVGLIIAGIAGLILFPKYKGSIN